MNATSKRLLAGTGLVMVPMKYSALVLQLFKNEVSSIGGQKPLESYKDGMDTCGMGPLPVTGTGLVRNARA